jgi:hemerythrin-like domain-containing protein
MKSTEILFIEHKLILQALLHLFAAKERLEKDEKPPVEFFRMAIVFFQNFADAYHHFKEDFLMFGLFARKKRGELDREIGMLRYEHERCRSYIVERDDKGYWNQIETYIRDHSEAEFSHGICPDYAKKLYPEFYDKVKKVISDRKK